MEQNIVYRFEGTFYHEDGINNKDVREEWPSNNLAIISAVIWGSEEGFDIVKVYKERNRKGGWYYEIVANITL